MARRPAAVAASAGVRGDVGWRVRLVGVAAVGQSSRLLFYHSIYTHDIQSTRWRIIPATGTPSLRGILCSASVCVCVCVELSRVCALAVEWGRSVAKDRFIAKNGENQSLDFCITRCNCRNARAPVCEFGGVGGRSETKNGKKRRKTATNNNK